MDKIDEIHKFKEKFVPDIIKSFQKRGIIIKLTDLGEGHEMRFKVFDKGKWNLESNVIELNDDTFLRLNDKTTNNKCVYYVLVDYNDKHIKMNKNDKKHIVKIYRNAKLVI